MSPLVESLKLKDGQLRNISWHQDRLNRAMNEMFPHAEKIDLQRLIAIPENCHSGVYKVRVIYGPTVERVEIEPYIFRTIESLKVVHHESVNYHLKYTDRQILQELFTQRGDCDDIIIVKNGLVSDSFAANLLFYNGENWFTPISPLLKGTKRQFLLDCGLIKEEEIREENIRNYEKIGLVNALVDFEEMPVILIDRIVY